ncbi:hypothetical protein ACPTFF_30910, partial [Pseudomonas aeruginosa]|uniref:hypothetical protein n=1 Tax=Pseudomonas aeruginosa TaxID=287 RepID=UPI003CC5892F
MALLSKRNVRTYCPKNSNPDTPSTITTHTLTDSPPPATHTRPQPPQVDLRAVGTNDPTQYRRAGDRNNPRDADLYD